MSWLDLLLVAAPVAPAADAFAALALAPAAGRALLVAAALPGVAAGVLAAGAEAAARAVAPGFLFGVELGLAPSLGWPMAAVALVWGLAALHGLGERGRGRGDRRYLVCFALAMAGQMATFVARDLATFYAGFAALGFAAYGLVAHRGDGEAGRAARIYVGFVVLGELALFAAFALIASARGGALAVPAEIGGPPPAPAYWLLAVGFGAKAGLVPLHVWLPLAHPVAPVPASAALSGATLKAGLLGLLLFAPAEHAPPGFGAALIGLGMLGAFAGAALAALQRDAKTALAWSSVSQMGLALALWGAAADGRAAPEAAAAAIGLVVIHHALAKAALFLAVAPGLPRAAALAVAALPALSLTGAPLTLGYAAKAAAADALGAGALGVAFTAAAFGTALALARALRLTAAKPGEASAARAAALLGAVLALAAAPWALGLAALPKDAAAAAAALAPALAALAIGAAASALGAAPPRWASADATAPAGPLRAAPSAAGAAFAALLGRLETARAGALAALRALGAPILAAPPERGEALTWLAAAGAALAALAAFALAAV